MRVVITLLCLAALSVAVFAASASEDFQTFWDETLVKVIALTPSTIVDLSVDFWSYVAPGGKWHPTKFIAWGGHYALETSLVVIIVYLLLQNAYKPSKADLPLTEEEIDTLCAEWHPEPLAPQVSQDPCKTCNPTHDAEPKAPLITSSMGTWVTVNEKSVLNMVSSNFLGIAGNKEIMKMCSDAVKKYGVGACGPRGFYGTIDVHLTLEERIARFMGRQEAIIYAYDMATVPSVIPAFANAKDLIICDEAVSYPIQNGCLLSRAKVRYFKHNDMADLERVLVAVDAEDRRLKKPLNRRFIVVEGIYQHYGDLAPLDAIYDLKQRFKYRLLVDESLSFGVLGATGRGAAEHFGLEPGQVEITAASLGNSMATVGGFCTGDREMVDHQRLSGSGYCFSAALPPYLASAAIGAFDLLEASGPALIKKLAANAAAARSQLAGIPGLRVLGGEADSVSPWIHVGLVGAPEGAASLLQSIADECVKAKDGVLLTLNKTCPVDRIKPEPTLRIAVTAAMEKKEITKAVACLKAAAKKVLKTLPAESSEGGRSKKR